MEIKHPPENGNCSCKECYKPMSKLDELDKEFEKELPRYAFKHSPHVVEAAVKKFVRKQITKARLEEREAMKRFVEKLPTATRSECENEKVVCAADLLNELNKN